MLTRHGHKTKSILQVIKKITKVLFITLSLELHGANIKQHSLKCMLCAEDTLLYAGVFNYLAPS